MEEVWGKGSRLGLGISGHMQGHCPSRIDWVETYSTQKPQQIWDWSDVLFLIPALLPIGVTQEHQVAVPESLGKTL